MPPSSGWTDEHFDLEKLIHRMFAGYMDKADVLTRMEWNGMSRKKAENMLDMRIKKANGLNRPLW
jgi:hypothetical protein